MKNFRLSLFLLTTIFVLAACNTADKPITEPASDTVTANSDIKDKVETDKPSITNEEADANNISYTSNGQEHTEQTTAIDGEKYTIQAIPGFALTAEEPGRDVLYLEKDDSIFMRIEFLSNDDTTYENLVANTEETIAAVNEEFSTFDLTSYIEKDQFINSTGYSAQYEEETVVMIVTEKEDQLIRLSIYDNPQHDLTDAMVKMGLTIQAK